MKITTSCWLLLVCIILNACNKSKDTVTPALVGKWQYITLSTSTLIAGKAVTETDNYSGQDASYEFKSDGTYNQRTPDSTSSRMVSTAIETGTYELSGNQITFTVVDPTTKLSFHKYATYSQTGNNLTFMLTKDLILKQLTESQLTDPDPFVALLLNLIKTYDIYTVTLTMQKI